MWVLAVKRHSSLAHQILYNFNPKNPDVDNLIMAKLSPIMHQAYSKISCTNAQSSTLMLLQRLHNPKTFHLQKPISNQHKKGLIK